MNQRIRAIATNTVRESIRNRVLYGVGAFAIMMVFVSAFLGKVTIGDQVKVVKDFGLFCVSLSSVLTVVILGSTLLVKELQRKTIYNILGKAVRRSEFIFGKFLGLFVTSVIVGVCMTVFLAGFVALLENRVDTLIFQAYIYMCLELSIVSALTIFFSSLVVTPMLVGMFTFATFLAGRCSEYVLYFSKDTHSAESALATTLYWILPHFDWLNVNNEVVYGHTPALSHMLLGGAYVLCYSTVLLLVATGIFSRREFN